MYLLIHPHSMIVNVLGTGAHILIHVENHKLVGMDIGTDSLVLMVLSNEEFKRAQELAKELLHRIDVAERL